MGKSLSAMVGPKTPVTANALGKSESDDRPFIDALLGDDRANYLLGGLDDDHFEGLGGADTLIGGGGSIPSSTKMLRPAYKSTC